MIDRFTDVPLEGLLGMLRNNGWYVAIHNDYILKGAPVPDEQRTFWLFTHSCGVYIKGEAPTDREAVLICARTACVFPSPP